MEMNSSAKKASEHMTYWQRKLSDVPSWKCLPSLYVKFNTVALQLNVNQIILWENIMAKKSGEMPKVEFRGFANLEVPQEAKEDVKLFLRDDTKIMDAITLLILDGHKVTVSTNEKNQAFQASAFCTYPKSPNAGYILSAFAGSWYDALGVLAWKHVVLSARGKWRDEGADAEMPEFG